MNFSGTGQHWLRAARLLALAGLLAPAIAACGFGTGKSGSKEYFSESSMGVKASPRAQRIVKGGGRYMVGSPYTVAGRTFVPKDDPNYRAQGKASWYGSAFHGRYTANGEIFDVAGITGAHPTLPLPSYARVTNHDNGRSIVVRLNDRGPFSHGRVVDVSQRTAELLGFRNAGVANVSVAYVGPAPLEGDDTRQLLASLDNGGGAPFGTQTTGVMVASAPATAPSPVTPLAPAAYRPASPAPMVMFGNTVLSPPPAELMSYAASDAGRRDVVSAHDAVNAMAESMGSLADWQQANDADALAVRIELGVFSDRSNARRVIESFAFLGAVDEEAARVGSTAATRLVLTRLKPGVTRADVLGRAQELGLNDILLY